MNKHDLLTKKFKNPDIYIAELLEIRQISVTTKKGYSVKLCEYFARLLTPGPLQGYDVRGTMNVDRAKRYFNFCCISSEEAIGKLVQVTMHTREFINAKGEPVTVDEIHYLNFLKENGQPLVMW